MRTAFLALIGGAIGWYLGLPVGVVGYGGGWSGAVIFGPLGAVIGLLAGLAIRRR